MNGLGIALMPEHPPAKFAALAACAERLGFSHLWIPDERFWRDLAVCMTEAIMSTTTMTIGSAVTDPYVRHPALTAQMMATLDELSGGRVVCGIGAGIAGFDALHIERRSPARAIREAVELMRGLWSGEAAGYEGETVRFGKAGLDFSPLRPDIPIYVAGRGPRVLSLAGEVADGVMIGSLASQPGLDFAFRRLQIGLERAGRERRDVHRVIWLHTAIHDNQEAAEAAVGTIVSGVLVSSAPVLSDWGIDLPAHIASAINGVTYGLNSPGMQQVRELLSPEVIRHFAVAGRPEYVRDRFQQLFEAGIDHIAVVPWLTPDQDPERFAETLMSAVEPVL
jgi:5,10-methylenetetrahydromethanopterin reductase